MAEVTIYTAATQSEQYTELEELRVALLTRAKAFTAITDETSLEKASEFSAQCQAHAKKLDDERLRMTEGARKTVALINDAFNPKIAELRNAADLVRRAVISFMAERKRAAEAAERERQRKVAEAEEQARLAREAAAKDEAQLPLAVEAAAAVDKAVEEIITAPVVDTKRVTGSYGSTTTLVGRWAYELVDIARVPDAFLKPPAERLNREPLNRVCTAVGASHKKDGATEDTTAVPGIRFFLDHGLQQRTGRSR